MARNPALDLTHEHLPHLPVFPRMGPVDPGAALAAVRAAGRMRAALEPLADAFRQFGRHIVAWANDPTRIAGLQATYAVRAALDGRYETPAALHTLIAGLIGGTGSAPDLLWPLVTRENRCAVAAAALRGWVTGHPGQATPRLTFGGHGLLCREYRYGDTLVIL